MNPSEEGIENLVPGNIGAEGSGGCTGPTCGSLDEAAIYKARVYIHVTKPGHGVVARPYQGNLQITPFSPDKKGLQYEAGAQAASETLQPGLYVATARGIGMKVTIDPKDLKKIDPKKLRAQLEPRTKGSAQAMTNMPGVHGVMQRVGASSTMKRYRQREAERLIKWLDKGMTESLDEADEWDSVEGRKKVVGKHPSGKLMVKVGDQRFPVLLDPKELEREKEFDAKRLASHQKMKATVDKEKQQAAAAQKARDDTDGFADKMPPMKKAKVIATLRHSVTHGGKLISRRDLIRMKVKSGSKVVGNRLENPDGTYIPFGKIGLDYARYLVDNPRKLKESAMNEGFQHVHFRGSSPVKVKVSAMHGAKTRAMAGRTFGKWIAVHTDPNTKGPYRHSWTVTHLPTGAAIVTKLANDEDAVRVAKKLEAMGDAWNFSSPDEAPEDLHARVKPLVAGLKKATPIGTPWKGESVLYELSLAKDVTARGKTYKAGTPVKPIRKTNGHYAVMLEPGITTALRKDELRMETTTSATVGGFRSGGLRGGPGGLSCPKCGWTGSCDAAPDGKCPKCGASLSQVGRGKPPVGEADKMQIAKTIMDQIGKKALFMIGAKNFVATDSGLRFRVGRNGLNVNVIDVQYNRGPDDYTLDFLAVRGTSAKSKKKIEHVYADQLTELIGETLRVAVKMPTFATRQKLTNETTAVRDPVSKPDLDDQRPDVPGAIDVYVDLWVGHGDPDALVAAFDADDEIEAVARKEGNAVVISVVADTYTDAEEAVRSALVRYGWKEQMDASQPYQGEPPTTVNPALPFYAYTDD